VLYGRALGTTGSFTMPGSEITVRAEPYFFSLESETKGQLQYRWTLNGSDTSGPNSAAGELTLRQSGSGQGTASLSVSLQNLDSSKLLQGAQLYVQVLFGGATQGNLFGL